MSEKTLGVENTLLLRIVTALFAIASCGAAHPQAASQGKGDETAAQGGTSDSLQEIVVTAERRSARLQDVPSSITAISGDTLANAAIGSSRQLDQLTPGLQMGDSGAYVQPTIRGIGTTVTAPGADANVSMYVDGVYMPTQNGNYFDFLDVKDIEVLKGPQGTLYGRNATGGSINITTLTPSFSPAADIQATYATFNERKIAGYVSGPIVGDTLAGSFAWLYDYDDGYANNLYDGTKAAYDDHWGGRGKLLWEATQQLRFVLSFDYNNAHDSTGYALKPLNGNTAVSGAVISANPRNVDQNTQPIDAPITRGANLAGTYDFGSFTFNEISSWRHTTVGIRADLDATAQANDFVSFNDDQVTYTQEINLTSSGAGPFKWVVGAYYYNDKADEDNINVDGLNLVTQGQVTSHAWALYGQSDYNLTDRLILTTGFRYSEERRALDTLSALFPAPIFADASFSSPTERLALRYDVTDQANIYASYSSGFKSGTYNVTDFSTSPVRPEKIGAYEAGYKYADNRLSFDAAAFYYDYKDIQVEAVTPLTGLTTLQNAARSNILGAEADMTARLPADFNLTGGVAWTHATYASFPAADVATPVPGGGNLEGPVDATGNTMIRAPRLSGNVGLAYTCQAFGGPLAGSLNEYFNSGYYWDPANRLQQPKFQVLNAQLKWSPPNSQFSVTVWGRNLTNTRYELYVNEVAFGDQVSYAAPRQIGVTFGWKL